MANIQTSPFKRFLAVGCSHGHLADPTALSAVLDFSARWKPHSRIHLGDYMDVAPFRSGAQGTHDEVIPIPVDLTAGCQFLREYRPTHLINGNHEERLWAKMHHQNAIVSHAATSVVKEIYALTKKMRTQFVDHYDIRRSWITLGDTKFLHGWMYGESAIRDHAEQFGKCVLAHLHTVGEAAGRREGGPKAYCVGSLADFHKMDYAKNRRSTSRWANGLAFGEYNDKETVIWLTQRLPSGLWRMPV